jgi:hypothetical protein
VTRHFFPADCVTKLPREIFAKKLLRGLLWWVMFRRYENNDAWFHKVRLPGTDARVGSGEATHPDPIANRYGRDFISKQLPR